MGWGAYARDKNTSARVCAKNAGEGVFVGHYGTITCGDSAMALCHELTYISNWCLPSFCYFPLLHSAASFVLLG